jgi:cell division septation protein DedD
MGPAQPHQDPAEQLGGGPAASPGPQARADLPLPPPSATAPEAQAPEAGPAQPADQAIPGPAAPLGPQAGNPPPLAPAIPAQEPPEPVHPPAPPAASQAAPAPAGGYLLHVGLFVGPVQSGRLAQRLHKIGYRAWVRQEDRQGKTRYLVLLGPFPDEALARQASEDIARRLGVSPFLMPAAQPAAMPPQGSS